MNSIDWVVLSVFDDFLSVVQEEHAKEDEATIHGHRHHASSQGSGGRQKPGAWTNKDQKIFAHKNKASLTIKYLNWERKYTLHSTISTFVEYLN